MNFLLEDREKESEFKIYLDYNVIILLELLVLIVIYDVL